MSDVRPKPVRKPDEEIKMKIVFGTTRLNDLYFYPTDETNAEGIFLLSNKHDETLTLVKSGQPFIFEHDGLVWQVPNPLGGEPFSIDRKIASGSFLNNAKTVYGKPGDPDVEEEGTFTAQASGGQDQDASAASAGAH